MAVKTSMSVLSHRLRNARDPEKLRDAIISAARALEEIDKVCSVREGEVFDEILVLARHGVDVDRKRVLDQQEENDEERVD